MVQNRDLDNQDEYYDYDPCYECPDYGKCDYVPGECPDNHDCISEMELEYTTDSFMAYFCQICGIRVSGYVGQFGVMFNDTK